ncbi:MAG: hypothetical protein LUG50_08355 [Planctomycetaceae bacterium]|nr:hypothetical protein [Planctomycetaceae bacterium]
MHPETSDTVSSPRVGNCRRMSWGRIGVILLFIIAVVLCGREIRRWSGPTNSLSGAESISGESPDHGVLKELDRNGNHIFTYKGDRFSIPCPPAFQPSMDSTEEPRALIHFISAKTENTAFLPASHRTIIEVAGVSEKRITEREYEGIIAPLGQSLPRTIDMPFTWNAAEHQPGQTDVDVHAQALLTRVPIDDPLTDGLLFYQGTVNVSSEMMDAPETATIDCCIGFLFVKGRAFFLRAIDGSENADITGFVRKIVDWREAVEAANRE